MRRGEEGAMRGERRGQVSMLTLMSPERLVPKDHPIRRIKALADAQLVQLSGVFDRMYAQGGRPSIPPEALLKAKLLMALYTVRSERQFCEQLQYNLLYRYFLDLGSTSGPSTHRPSRRISAACCKRTWRGASSKAWSRRRRRRGSCRRSTLRWTGR